MSEDPIDLAERRRRRDAARTLAQAQKTVENAPAADQTCESAPPLLDDAASTEASNPGTSIAAAPVSAPPDTRAATAPASTRSGSGTTTAPTSTPPGTDTTPIPASTLPGTSTARITTSANPPGTDTPTSVTRAEAWAPASSDDSAIPGAIAYAELHCLSDFSFQRGASSADELFERASRLGYSALAITDECSLAGIVRARNASRDHGLPLIVGSEFRLDDGLKLVLLVQDQQGYAGLCQVITRARHNSAKGEYSLSRAGLEHLPGGLLVLWLPPSRNAGTAAAEQAQWIKNNFPQRSWIAVELHRDGSDGEHLAWLRQLSREHGLPLVAAGDVHMHQRRRRALQDVMTAIRLNTTVDQAGHALFPNGERHLRPLPALQRIYDADLLAESVRIAALCHFRLDSLRYEYPAEVVPAGLSANAHLRALTWAGAAWRWPGGISPRHQHQLEFELDLISQLKYEHFFLTVHDIVHWARTRPIPILCQGRGSAANSAVCYCLGITSIDPVKSDLLFERFISAERDEPPDIDVDFEHERREEVIQHVFEKYGRHRAALAATVIMYRRKSAARDVGRALGLGDDQLNQLSEAYSHAHGNVPLAQRLIECGFDPASRLMRQLVVLVEELRGSPRHLSQHVGGFVISQHPLHTLVPVENASMPDRTVIQWDKDDLESLKLLKVDCLALGMLTCLRKCFDLLRMHCGKNWDLASLPPEDKATYTMIQKADTIGVFQIESRAQMSMLPRLRPEKFYDLVVEIAIVRPGPIEGGMVHPYLRRRKGLEPIEYPQSTLRSESDNVEKQNKIAQILERTCGVPIFQEQVMKLVQEVAGFTPGRADQLRRSMGSWRNDGTVEKFQQEIFDGMRERGYEKYAEGLFNQIRGFGSYGFPESHSASFALLAYASSYIKCHHPAVFTCALLNSQPMGFYSPAQLIQDARRHGVTVHPIDVCCSSWDCHLETQAGTLALRLGLRLLKGASQMLARRIVDARTHKPFASVADLVQRAGLDRFERERLAEAGALRQLAGHRHRARWYSAGAERLPPLLADAQTADGPITLRPPSTAENVEADYATQGYSLESHPIALIRPQLRRQRLTDSRQLRDCANGASARLAGLVTVRQRPPEAGGVTFLTLEDEYGQVNLVVWERIALRYRRALLESTVLYVEGKLQIVDDVVHLVAQRLDNYSGLLPRLGIQSRDFH
ncbi:error-prone DNA polymerase [Tahibacter harae]|uniref:Error-prone DNA polymerase n=1 Tax=Tahibacter harae TaxID=2963937 RepID=A0ABT1QZ70_9GAMM|nr:error-prone DNA polymerase [Tahibacter harae]MCQ4167587.1 error-prone DNA polymerase [Tahibacter harae]